MFAVVCTAASLAPTAASPWCSAALLQRIDARQPCLPCAYARELCFLPARSKRALRELHATLAEMGVEYDDDST